MGLGGNMNKEKAIDALHDGKIVKHSGFAPEEWVKQDGHLYVFEDGCQCTHREFWQHRTQDWWDEGWSVIDKPIK